MSNLVINDFRDIRMEVRPQAQVQAQAALREQNKMEWVADLTLVGTTRIAAGNTISVKGFGVYDGKYLVRQAVHDIGGEYTTTIKATRALSY
jgi:phage protein D